MIEKIYKEALGEIHGDKKAILDKAFERAQKPVKRQNPVLKYSFIGTAAAAVLIAGAIFINIDLFKITEPKNFEDDAVISESASDEKETEYEALTDKTEEAVYESETKPQYVNKTEKSDDKTENRTAAKNSVKKGAKQKASGAVNGGKAEQNNAKKDVSSEIAVNGAVSDSGEEQNNAKMDVTSKIMVNGAVNDSEAAQNNAKKDASSEIAGNGAVYDSGEEKRAEKSIERAVGGTEPESNQIYMVTADSNSYGEERYTEPQPEANGIEAYSGGEDDYYSDRNEKPTGGMRKAGMYGAANRAYDEKVMTYEEYKEYLGFDVTALVMPQGVAPIEAPDKCVLTVDDSGEIVDDIVVFENKDEAKPVVVTAGRLLDVEWALKDGNTEAIISEESGVIYAQKNGAGFIVDCMNMAGEEVHAIEAQFKDEQ